MNKNESVSTLLQETTLHYQTLLKTFIKDNKLSKKIFQLVKDYQLLFLLLPSIAIFILLLLPYMNVIPYLDGDGEFRIAVNFYHGHYLSNWMPYHPPLKLLLSSLIFHLFGFFSYSYIGCLLGVVGIIAFYFIAEVLFDKRTAVISSVLLSVSGIYIATALFSVNDFLVTVFLLLSFSLYVNKKYFWAAVLACCAVFSKESAIIFPLSIIIVEGFQKKIRLVNLIPFFGLSAWIIFLRGTGHTLWNDWNFSSTSDKGSAWTIMNNVYRGTLFNKYAYENWLHLFVFNYNWVLWIVALFSLFKLKWNNNIAVLVLFSFLYTVIILSFQTFTITRYILPIYPLLYLLVAVQLRYTKYTFFFMLLVSFCVLASLFTSNDPVSNTFWVKSNILDQQFYLNRALDGTDGITYNMQFLYLTKERDRLLRQGTCSNDIQALDVYPETLSILHIPPCR